MKKYLLLLFLLLFATPLYALDEHINATATTKNGILIKKLDTPYLRGISAEIFTDYVTTSTNMVFNESGSTTSGMGTTTPGMIDTWNYLPGEVSLAIQATGFKNGAATLTACLHQFIGTSSKYGSITISMGTGSINFPVMEYSQYLSLGIKPDTGSITVNAFLDAVTKKLP